MQVLTTMASGHHESHSPGYAQDSWAYAQQYSHAHHHHQHSMSPMNEYAAFNYGQSSLPMEPTYAMQRPPPYVTNHPLPPPLVMPQNGVWPSMLTSQNTYQQPILPATGNHIHTPVSAAPSHGSELTPTSAKSTSRRKLTDEERRQMCLEAEQNPTMKQTQIGAKFNVERSTVSKILRQKEKYMKPAPKEEMSSPGRKSKIKLPDVEKTLANWARNQEKKGITITDEELRKQALMFSAGRSDQQLLSSQAWLDKFKVKYLEGKGDLATSLIDTPGAVSSPSDDELALQSIHNVEELSLEGSKLEDGSSLMEFSLFESGNALTQALALNGNPSEEIIVSPVSPILTRTDGLAVIIGEDDGGIFNFPSRQRSQTFPHLPEAVGLSNSSPNLKTMAISARSATSTDVTKDASIDPRRMIKRHKSVPDIHNSDVISLPSMQPPPLPRADMSPTSNPASPSAQDENIRALYSIKKLLEQRPDVAEPDDYIMIGKLLEKLKLLRSPCGTPIISHSINPLEKTRSPRLSKKRTIIGIST